MKAIKSRDTKPEMIVRKLLHRNGYRFRLSPVNLPGKPDIWMTKWNTAIFINGCFWHMHDCDMFRLPGTRTDFWRKKLDENRERDQNVIRELTSSGIRVLVIWECSLRGKKKLTPDLLLLLIKTFLRTDFKISEITSSGIMVR